jgi:hypothetical protein
MTLLFSATFYATNTVLSYVKQRICMRYEMLAANLLGHGMEYIVSSRVGRFIILLTPPRESFGPTDISSARKLYLNEHLL